MLKKITSFILVMLMILGMSTTTFAFEKADKTSNNFISGIEQYIDMKNNRMVITNEKAILNYIKKSINQLNSKFDTKLTSNEDK